MDIKKLGSIFLLSFAFLLVFSGTVQAFTNRDPAATGIVPCGVSMIYTCRGVNPSNPSVWTTWTTSVGQTCNSSAGGYTSVSTTGSSLAYPCTLTDFFQMLLNIYNLVIILAFAIAAFCVVLGGVLYVLAAGNPALASTAKSVLWGAAIGLALVLGAWLIVNVTFQVLGYPVAWSTF